MPYTTHMNELTSAQRRALATKAHSLEPVVIIGDAGLTPAVIGEIDVHLKSHELIKIRVHGDDRAARISMIGEISTALDATLIKHIGKILTIFRPKPAQPAAKAAGKPVKLRARNKQRRTKRSYQGH